MRRLIIVAARWAKPIQLRQVLSRRRAMRAQSLRSCQHSRQTWWHELDDELRLRWLENGENSNGTTEMP
jgi:hypothetical protein